MEWKKEQVDVSMSTTTKITQSPYESIAELKGDTYQFSFSASKRWLEAEGKRLYGPHFYIDPADRRLLNDLLVYAVGDRVSARQRKLDLRKGILLTGPVGCGKTTLMTLLNSFFPRGKHYRVKSTREISFEFEAEGFRVIRRYVTGTGTDYRNAAPPIFCFDDLGIEQAVRHFGNECDVMGEILLSRYDLFVKHRIPTHVTTNLSASEIEQRYGNRVRSRMREMFNLFAFDKSAKDKRV